MSSTWSFAKQAAVMRAPATGAPFYLLSESTCESNVFPRKSRFSNVFFGTLADSMRHVVKTSCYAEGGCLKAGNGRPTTPEKQIGTWREAMKAPVPLQYGEVTLAFGGFYGVELKHRDEAYALLLPLGAQEIRGSLVIRLDAPMVCETLASLIKRHQLDGFATWRVFPHHQYPQGLADPDLAHKPRKTRSTAPLSVSLFRGARPGQFGDRFVLMANGDDGTAEVSHDYRLIQTYTGTHISELEAREPGTAESRIMEFREALANAPGIPDALEVRVSVRENQHAWLNEHFERLCKEASATATNGEVVLSGAQLEATNTLYLLQSFQRSQIRVTNVPPPMKEALPETASLF